jgi:hypothetical protein
MMMSFLTLFEITFKAYVKDPQKETITVLAANMEDALKEVRTDFSHPHVYSITEAGCAYVRR